MLLHINSCTPVVKKFRYNSFIFIRSANTRSMNLNAKTAKIHVVKIQLEAVNVIFPTFHSERTIPLFDNWISPQSEPVLASILNHFIGENYDTLFQQPTDVWSEKSVIFLVAFNHLLGTYQNGNCYLETSKLILIVFLLLSLNKVPQIVWNYLLNEHVGKIYEFVRGRETIWRLEIRELRQMLTKRLLVWKSTL